jgi:glycosyltransferase involved in cell wall biosynthesis
LALFLLDCLACCLLDKTVFVGEYDWRLFKRIIPLRKLYLIRNGVVVREEQETSKKDGMVYLGRISPEKNVLRLIEAAEAAGVEVDLYGPFDRHDTKFREKVLQLIQSSRYAEWKGPLYFEDVQPTLSKYRVFVNPSFSEGLPLSVLEAAAEGLYLFLSDIPQHRLLGFPACTYVDPYVLDLTPALSIRNSEGQRNREHVKCEFDVRKMIEAYSAIYRRLI